MHTVGRSDNQFMDAACFPANLPANVSFSDGHCYFFEADYNGGSETQCVGRPASGGPSISPPSCSRLKYVGIAWRYAAWRDDAAKTTIVTAPDAKPWQPLFTAEMATLEIMTMNVPDYPGVNVTLVGKLDGRLTLVTLKV